MDLTRRAHELVSQHFRNKDKNLAVDATCGNGFDTEFLAQLGFNKVLGFDVQQQAINTTQQRLSNAGLDNTELICAGHENLENHVTGKIDCAMFNFGYLPNIELGGITNKSITTAAETSLTALNASLKFLSEEGLMSLMCYPGHPQGRRETEAIKSWLTTLPGEYRIENHLARSPKPTAPTLFIVKM